MKFKFLFFLFLFSTMVYSQNEKLEDPKMDPIRNLIALFQEKNIAKISNIINYPLKREYPIPSIKNQSEFKKRFNEVFDTILIYKIANSKLNQWSDVGWRGIILDDGMVWIDSENGKIKAINYQSQFEKNLKNELIVKDKENLHTSLRTFEIPTYKIKTKNYLIRIDELSNSQYRYASWKISKSESSKPDLILQNGIFEFQGSSGNHLFIFKKGNYTYKVYRNITREENTSEITLEVEKDGSVFLKEEGILME